MSDVFICDHARTPCGKGCAEAALHEIALHGQDGHRSRPDERQRRRDRAPSSTWGDQRDDLFVREADRLAQRFGPRFAPSAWLRPKAERGEPFYTPQIERAEVKCAA